MQIFARLMCMCMWRGGPKNKFRPGVGFRQREAIISRGMHTHTRSHAPTGVAVEREITILSNKIHCTPRCVELNLFQNITRREWVEWEASANPVERTKRISFGNHRRSSASSQSSRATYAWITFVSTRCASIRCVGTRIVNSRP